MAIEPLRFIHASDLRLDRSLDVEAETGDELRDLLSDAPLDAFQRVVAAALEHEVDFLLVTGPVCETGGKLSARAELTEGCRRLAERNIPVYIDRTAVRLYPEQLPLPDGLRLLPAGDEASIAVDRDDRTAAVLTAVDFDDPTAGTKSVAKSVSIGVATSNSNETDGASRVDVIGSCVRDVLKSSGSAPFDYIAVPGTERETHHEGDCVVNAPGCIQAVDASETGVKGCTLVRVERGVNGVKTRITCETLPTATVRWETVDLDVRPGTTLDDLQETFVLALENRFRDAAEWAAVVAWNLSGSGPGLELLIDESLQRRITKRAVKQAVPLKASRVAHVFRQAVDAGLVRDRDDEMTAEYFETLEGELHQIADVVDSVGFADAAQHRKWLQTLDVDRIVARARQLGWVWFNRNDDANRESPANHPATVAFADRERRADAA